MENLIQNYINSQKRLNKMDELLSNETRYIHAGQDPDPLTGAMCVPIVTSAAFAQKGPKELYSTYEYSRLSNPTRDAFETCFASSENAAHGIAFSSGSSAITAVAGLYGPGTHIICAEDIYGGVFEIFTNFSGPKQGIKVTYVNTLDSESVRNAFTDETKMLWLETPSNPTLSITDIEELSKIAHEHNCLVMVDNTFATPYCQNPLSLGADLVLHSITKYIGGHNDVTMGAIATNNAELAKELRYLQYILGLTASPFDCYLSIRGFKTLHLRMQKHSENAHAVALFLIQHPLIEKVFYPGLPNHPNHDIAKKQMKMFSGIVSFYIKGQRENVTKFVKALKIFKFVSSLGSTDSIVSYPVIMSHEAVPEEKRLRLGITDSMVRLSVGIENISDIVADLSQALEKSQGV